MNTALRNIRLLTSLLLSFYICHFSFSNGGTYDHSHFRKTGNIRLMQKADVKLLKEDLKITIKGDYSFVEVKYTLQNNGNDQKIYYGFPVDAWGADACFGMPCGPPFRFIRWGDDFNENIVCVDSIINDFEIKLDEKKLNHSVWVEDTAYFIKSDKTWRDSINIGRKWHQVYFEMKKGETSELTVYYKIKNGYHDNSPGFSSTPVFDERNFTYHMTPSGNWGNGIVDEFNVTIDLEDISLSACKMKMEGLLDLKKNGNIYSATYKNFDLEKSDRINISYRQDFKLVSKFIQNNRFPNNTIISYSSSSDDKNLKNLFDEDENTVWKAKVGDYLVIYFDTISQMKTGYSYNSNGKIIDTNYYCVKPEAFYLLNGNFKSETDFSKSTKVRTVKILVNDTTWINSEPWKQEEGKKYFSIPESVYSGQMEKYPMGDASLACDGIRYSAMTFRSPVRKIKIYFSDIFKGEEEGFTISELIFIK